MVFFWLFPMWIIIFFVFAGLLLLIFWIWSIIDCLVSKLRVEEKIFWIIIMLVFNVLGSLLYLIFSKVGGVKVVRTGNLKGKKLVRSSKNRMIAGVCGGLGEYLGMDPTLIRLLWILITIFTGFFAGIIAYVIAWIVIPER